MCYDWLRKHPRIDDAADVEVRNPKPTEVQS